MVSTIDKTIAYSESKSSNKNTVFVLVVFFLLAQLIPFPAVSIFSAFFAVLLFVLFLCTTVKGRNVLFNIRLYFCVLGFLYINCSSIFYFLFGVSYFYLSFTNAVLLKGLQIANSALIIFIIFSVMTFNKKDYNRRTESLKNWFRNITPKYMILADIIFLVPFVDLIKTISIIGVNDIFSSGARAEILGMMDSDASQIISTIISGFVFAYSCMAVNCFLQWMFKRRPLSVVTLVRTILVVFYWFFVLVMGARSSVIILALFFVLSFFSINEKKIKKRQIILFVVIAILAVFVGYFRSAGFNFRKLLTADAIFASFGEFLAPIQPLFALIEQKYQLEYGKTYMNIVLYFIPRSIFPAKPAILADVIDEMLGFGNINTLMNPVAEAYMNFGVFAFLLFPIIFHLIFTLAEKYERKIPALYIVLFTGIFSILRADLARFVLLSLFFFVFLVLLPRKNSGKNGGMLTVSRLKEP